MSGIKEHIARNRERIKAAIAKTEEAIMKKKMIFNEQNEARESGHHFHPNVKDGDSGCDPQTTPCSTHYYY